MDVEYLYPKCNYRIEVPSNLEEMIQIAKELSEDFSFIRVDLYNVDKNIIFGEITFYNKSGTGRFTQDEFDETMGG